jgi:SAM-dependent methyltransferase
VTPNPWLAVTGGTAGPRYAARFAELAASGQDLDGEARRVHTLLAERPSDVLDAGCGTGRVARRLTELGHRVVGVDLDRSMLDEAQAAAPDGTWLLVDLAELPAPDDPADPLSGRRFDLVVAAGNLWPLLTPGTHGRVAAAIAARLRPDGRLISGFGLDAEHVPFTLPDEVTFFSLDDYDRVCEAAGLVLVERSADWDGREPRGDRPGDQGYAVSVHARPGDGASGNPTDATDATRTDGVPGRAAP